MYDLLFVIDNRIKKASDTERESGGEGGDYISRLDYSFPFRCANAMEYILNVYLLTRDYVTMIDRLRPYCLSQKRGKKHRVPSGNRYFKNGLQFRDW